MDEAILRRFNHAKQRRNSNWYSHFKECYHYAIPQRETLDHHEVGEKKNNHLYDSTAIAGTHIFANRVQQTVVPPGFKWGKLVAAEGVDEEQTIAVGGVEMTVEDALDKVTDIVFEYIHNSNFDTRINEALTDLAVSTGTITCEFMNDELVFDCVPLSHLYLEGGAKGNVEGFWREHCIQLRNVKKTWPMATIPENYSGKDENMEVTVIEGMIMVDDNYRLIVFIEDCKEIIYEEDFGDSSPWISFRWQVIPGEVYGRGPLMSILPDIKTINAMAKTELQAAQLSTLGMYTAVDDGVINPYTIEIAPGMIIPVASNSRENPTLSPMAQSGSVQFHEMAYDKRRDAINRALFANPIGSLDDPTKTATEISIRRQIDLQEAGAAFGRLNNELAGAVMKRVINVLSKEGKLPPLPEIDGEYIKIKYTTPLMQQNDIEEAQLLVRAVQMAGSMGLPPEVIMGDLKVEDMPSFLLDKLSGPAEMKRSLAEKEQMKQQAAQMAQIQMEQQQR